MSQSGGRRIKRRISFDLNTVRFLSEAEVESFSSYALLREYIAAKRNDLSEWNSSAERNPQINADIRRLTNIGTLRAYIESYLRNHGKIREDMTLLVRQQESTGDGLPIEIYCFTNTTVWGEYEGIQADIFDHILAITPEYGLRIFQNVSDASQGPLGGGGQAPALPAG
jgi:miniconductance mechanosensitive channel